MINFFKNKLSPMDTGDFFYGAFTFPHASFTMITRVKKGEDFSILTGKNR
ncbi:hypothetical protein [Peribacillus sp. NPDC096448]